MSVGEISKFWMANKTEGESKLSVFYYRNNFLLNTRLVNGLPECNFRFPS